MYGLTRVLGVDFLFDIPLPKSGARKKRSLHSRPTSLELTPIKFCSRLFFLPNEIEPGTQEKSTQEAKKEALTLLFCRHESILAKKNRVCKTKKLWSAPFDLWSAAPQFEPRSHLLLGWLRIDVCRGICRRQMPILRASGGRSPPDPGVRQSPLETRRLP